MQWLHYSGGNETFLDVKMDLVRVDNKLAAAALDGAITAWADNSTDATSARRTDLLRDKSKVVAEFFEFVGKPADQVTSLDVKLWQAELENRDLQPASVYAMVSRVSSFYRWARDKLGLADLIPRNPVDGARPKAPKPYSSESVKAIEEHKLKALLQYVKAKADSGDLVGLRDYAILLHLALTGRRRAEVMRLHWGDISTNGTMICRYKTKGGRYETYEVKAPIVKDAMLDYLKACERLEALDDGSPIWLSHRDSKIEAGHQLTSHGFAKQLKRYARKVGIERINVHQLRHTFAVLYGDESGSLSAVSDALGHKDLATTRIYIQQVGVRRDKASNLLAERLGLNGDAEMI